MISTKIGMPTIMVQRDVTHDWEDQCGVRTCLKITEIFLHMFSSGVSYCIIVVIRT